MALAVALEDKKIDTTTIVDTKKGVLSFYGKKVRDSKKGGYGKISVAEAFEVSSNTGIVSAIDQAYKDNPSQFVDGLYEMNLNDSLQLPLVGEGKAIIPDGKKLQGTFSLESASCADSCTEKEYVESIERWEYTGNYVAEKWDGQTYLITD